MAELGETSDPRALVPGDPAAIEENARVLRDRSEATARVGDGLGKIDTGSWTGPAATQFHDKFSYEPAKWLAASDSFDAVAESLTSYAQTLRWAQGQANDAIRQWSQGQAATAEAKDRYTQDVADADAENRRRAANGDPARVTAAPFSDPGEAIRQAARETLGRARQQLTEAGDRAATTTADEAGGAPTATDWLDDVGGFFADFGEGTWNAFKGFGEGAWNLVLAVGDPGNPDHEGLTDIASAAWHNITHPVDFGKQLISWDDWADHPGRATGQIVGGLLIGGAAAKVLKGARAGEKPEPVKGRPPVKAKLSEYFDPGGSPPKATELGRFAEEQGWTKQQTPNGPPKYVDDNGVVRMTLKQGSSRAPGSENPHVELRNADGVRVDPEGNPVNRKSPGNHTPITWDQ
ncbi:hypothetical protein H4696_009350 [Amycolatopsis lexingtonensis]|uniref:Putative T7SS secretion signal domain-containing protein n=1 Tax=Amycolatopsis lexingtonensis TaxID=218822 RepID=A0ABR9IGG4_9PSEU|nr:hypothetical protein [Amycolatopsis lexingtonensis]MBE1502250.1 hypothetical protein [Amycolatopsis lexingtonensis]